MSKLRDLAIQNAFQECFNASQFCDVKIVFKDNEAIFVHKIILASSSFFLKTCLKNSNEVDQEHALMILPDFDIQEFR